MDENKQQLSVLEKIDEILLRCDELERFNNRMGIPFICQEESSVSEFAMAKWKYLSILPVSELVNPSELYRLIELCGQMNFLEVVQSKLHNGYTLPLHFKLSVEGYKRINELCKSVDSKQAFIAMSFSPDLNSLADAICEVVKDCGYSPCHLDLPPHSLHNENICNKIIGEIKRSKFVIADFTLDRPNVYWEAGFAKGLGREVIHTVHENWKDKIAFDIKQTKFIEWPSLEELKRQLKEYIQATVD